MKLDPLESKFKSFGFDVFVSNGHDIDDIMNNYDLMVNSNKPTCLIANTIKGKGVSFMENKPYWHYWNPLSDDEIKLARSELS